MPKNSGKFRTTPQPRVALGQLWRDKSGTVRRVVEPLDSWEVHFANVVTGKRSRVQRVSKDGAPGGYEHVPLPESQKDPVHVRRAYGGELSDTFCGLLAAGLITTTLDHVEWWKSQGKELCQICMKRATDGVHAALERSEAA